MAMELTELTAISPIDGRYRKKTAELGEYLSEFGLIKARVKVEVAYLAALTGGALPDVPDVGNEARARLDALYDNFSEADAQAIKDLEKTTKHDVKAVEYWLRAALKDDPDFGQYLELIHFAITSEDTNNNAYNIILDGALNNVVVPAIDDVTTTLDTMSNDYADLPMLGQTHGQAAIPTTLGKETRVFTDRLEKSRRKLGEISLTGKLNGATGTYAAMMIAYPELDWPQFARDFVESLGFEFNGVTTQIEPHDEIIDLFDQLAHTNGIMRDIAVDIWLYIQRGVLKETPDPNATGSSTMPQKVNPIDFENDEGQSIQAVAMFRSMAEKLVASRLQRDLSDSTTLRSSGEAFGHMIVALSSLKNGLSKILPDEERIAEELNSEWSILAEAIQVVGRRYGEENVYDKIKEATRGKKLTQEGYYELVNGLSDKVPQEAKDRLLALTPFTYLGLATEIARKEVETAPLEK